MKTLEAKLVEKFPKIAWKMEVRNGDTILGYADWIEHMLESVAGVVTSSHGHLLIDMDDGGVLRCVEDTSREEAGALTNIIKFDLKEYFQIYGLSKKKVTSFDILDLGYWEKRMVETEVYEDPAYEWRTDRDKRVKEEA
jgi:hypothetical protein|tara:strand:- start:1093 stop:1509 length:417 start_codon:yes stop_codon:yes gene_type:complete